MHLNGYGVTLARVETIGPPVSPELPAGVTEHRPEGAQASRPPAEWSQAIELAARELGFAAVGFAEAQPFDDARRELDAYLDAGRHGSMQFLTVGDRADPRKLLATAQTVVSVALPHAGGQRLVSLRSKSAAPPAAIAGYALGQDYHRVIKLKLRRLADACATIVGRPLLARSCVDTAPLLEREAARRGGLGFTGKSTMSIIPGVGSYFLLGELLLDVAVVPSASRAQDGCGRCQSCLDACPTQAFIDAYSLDARRCIAYLTIEHRGVIPRELRRAMGTHVFGCDVCQDVCPYNAAAEKHPVAPELAPAPELARVGLVDLLGLTAAGYRRLVKGKALARATRRMLQRNAAIALGNGDRPTAVPPLLQALANPSALVRGHVAWGLGELARHAPQAVLSALETAAVGDPEPWVRDEARQALASLTELR